MLYFKLIDLSLALIVMFSLWYLLENKKGWILYAIGCFGYCIINFKVGLYGQAFVNIIAIGIALVNYYKSGARG